MYSAEAAATINVAIAKTDFILNVSLKCWEKEMDLMDLKR